MVTTGDIVSRELHGIGVSAGVAVGPLVVMAPPPVPPEGEAAAADPEAALATITQVFDDLASRLEARAALADATAAEIISADAMIARDPGLLDTVARMLNQGMGPAHAVNAAVEEFCDMLDGLGGYLAERVTDVRDIRDRVLASLLDQPEPGLPQLTVPSVVAAVDLAPAETAALTPETCLGIVIELGGPTSHTAILAAQLGIPAIVRAAAITSVPAGTTVAINGGTGKIIVEPTSAQRNELDDRERRRTAAVAGSSAGRGATRDGFAVSLLANIGTSEDARRAAGEAVEGVGLFRTEFLFLDRDVEPSLDEQTDTYTHVFSAFGDRRIVVRTLDAGADKPLKFADLGLEPNPALGRRGLRLGMARTDLLDTQLAALAAAYHATGADVRVMAPMIATCTEAAWFAQRVRAAGLPNVGVMVEVPAAALRARHVFEQVDFVSLGTNDLQQYTMAADRTDGRLADLLNPWEPAVLDLIGMTCDAGHACDKPVGVCGESAGDPALALVLVGLGVSSLSMATSKVAAVRASLAAHTLAQCQRIASAATSAATAGAARKAALAIADPILSDLL